MRDQEVWFFAIVIGVPIFAVFVFAAVAMAVNAWQNVRRAEQEAVLKREMLQQGRSAEDIERVLRASAEPPKATRQPTLAPTLEQQAIEAMVTTLGECGASGHVIEEVLAVVQVADPGTQQATCRTVKALIDGIVGQGADVKDEQVLAVVRGLRRPAKSAEEPEFAPSLDSAPRRARDETFHPVRPV
jgi:hypothetical protein